MTPRRRALTADEVEQVLADVAASVAAIDEQIRLSRSHQDSLARVSDRLRSLMHRLTGTSMG